MYPAGEFAVYHHQNPTNVAQGGLPTSSAQSRAWARMPLFTGVTLAGHIPYQQPTAGHAPTFPQIGVIQGANVRPFGGVMDIADQQAVSRPDPYRTWRG